MSKIIGIDLGTTNSAVAIIEGGEPNVLENQEGGRTTPSIVAVSKNGERLAGLLAKRQAVTNPKNTVYGIKRFIGHSFDDSAVERDMKTVPFEVTKSDNNGVLVTLGDKKYRPEEISAMILTKLKNDAEAKLGEKITEAIITVPAYFNDTQRQATKDAGKIAGLEVKRIINEPTAAALAYGFNKKKDEKIVVYDFGGGTFDISVLEVSADTIEVKATDGDSHMGGRDIDQKIINYFADKYAKETGIDLRKDALALQRLDEAAEKAKIELSQRTETEINIPFISVKDNVPQHMLYTFKKAELEELSKEFVDRSIEITKRAMEASPFKMNEIDEIVLVGGQTRMPMIQEAVKALFGKEPNKSINPDEVVAIGAAIQAGIMQGDVKDVLLLDVIPLSLGIETLGGVATKLIEKNTTIPASKSQVFSTASDNQTSVQIHVVQGERAMAADNKSLGQFNLDGIPPAPRGMPQVEVTFDVDVNGILSVKAREKASGKEQSIRIEARSGLSDADIEKMKKDAELHENDDKKKKEVIEAKNIAEQSIYTAERAIKDAGEKLPAEIKTAVEGAITNLKNVKEGSDLDAIKKETENLSREMQKIGEWMSKNPQGAPAGNADAGQAGGEPNPGQNPNGDQGGEPAGGVRDAEVS